MYQKNMDHESQYQLQYYNFDKEKLEQLRF